VTQCQEITGVGGGELESEKKRAVDSICAR
jgi:hypothetical protein